VTNQVMDVIAASRHTTRGELFKNTSTAPTQLHVLLDGSGVVMTFQLETNMRRADRADSMQAYISKGCSAVICGLTGNPSKHIYAELITASLCGCTRHCPSRA